MKLSHYITTAFLISAIPVLCISQEEDPYQKKYEYRIRQQVLYGVYIPKDVTEALVQLNKLTDEESKAKLKTMSEKDVVDKLFFSFGRWMTYNWSFYEGSRLSVNLRSMGIYDPDDMARFLMIVFHRSLNKKPLEIKELLKGFHGKEKNAKAERRKKGTVIYEEKRQREKPPEGGNGN
ncbi:MAG TPA: hypothetical protein ENJ95_02320 [Bacteroidetes bacterium]|nr:hypothetical protein [Bacteroidota bacterium]